MRAPERSDLGLPSVKEALSAALRSQSRSEAVRLITSITEFRDAAQCLLPVLRLARADQGMIDAAVKQALALFRGGWLQNRQLPSVLFCLRVADQEAWATRFCRHAVDKAQQTGDWSDFEKVLEWFVESCSEDEDPAALGFTRESLAAVWDRLSDAARARIRAGRDEAAGAPEQDEWSHAAQTPIADAIKLASGAVAWTGLAPRAEPEDVSLFNPLDGTPNDDFERGGISASSGGPSPAPPGRTPTDQLRALAARPLEELRARVASRTAALPLGSPERTELEQELARLDKAIKALP